MVGICKEHLERGFSVAPYPGGQRFEQSMILGGPDVTRPHSPLTKWVRSLRCSSIASSRRLIKASSTEITSSSAEMPRASSQLRWNLTVRAPESPVLQALRW